MDPGSDTETKMQQKHKKTAKAQRNKELPSSSSEEESREKPLTLKEIRIEWQKDMEERELAWKIKSRQERDERDELWRQELQKQTKEKDKEIRNLREQLARLQESKLISVQDMSDFKAQIKLDTQDSELSASKTEHEGTEDIYIKYEDVSRYKENISCIKTDSSITEFQPVKQEKDEAQPVVQHEEIELKNDDSDRYKEYLSSIKAEPSGKEFLLMKQEQHETLQIVKHEEIHLKNDDEDDRMFADEIRQEMSEDFKTDNGESSDSEANGKCSILVSKNTWDDDILNSNLSDFESDQQKTPQWLIPEYKSSAEPVMFQCNQCRYQTHKRRVMKNHFVRHKEPVLFKCHECDHETIYSCDFKLHLSSHRDYKEVIKMITCSICTFITTQKEDLKTHMCLNANPKEGHFLKCDRCEYRTGHKGNLRAHHLRHKKLNKNVKMFQCDQCDYQTVRNNSLRIHQRRRHNFKKVISLFQCDMCNFKTNHEHYLIAHVRLHGNEDVKFFKCDECDYLTSTKYNLTLHQRRHKIPDELATFKCYNCDFKTIYKRSIRDHIIRFHVNPKNFDLLKCNQCYFQTVCKSSLSRHIRRHNSKAKVL